MKKTAYLGTLLLAVIVTACGVSNGRNSASGPQGGPSAGALPASTQLIIGTIKLDGTAQAVTAEQAAELLPLWQTMKVLAESDTAAQQEKDALITQIQEAMTAGQKQAITAMNLSRADMMKIMQEQGTAMGSGSQNSSAQSRSSSNNGVRVFGPGGGGPPDELRGQGGGGGFGSGQRQNLSQAAIATAQAARQANENFIQPMLINAVIEYLQKKAGP